MTGLQRKGDDLRWGLGRHIGTFLKEAKVRTRWEVGNRPPGWEVGQVNTGGLE